MKVKTLLVFVPIILLNSCDDNTYHTVVRGTVINRGSKEPISNARVSLKDGVATSFFDVDGNTASDGRVETYSDENGEFEISLRGEHTAFLGAGKEGYYNFGVEGRGFGGAVKAFSDGEHSDVIVTLDAESYFNGLFYSPNSNISDSTIIKVYGTTWGGGVRIGKGPFRFANSENGIQVSGDFFIPYTVEFTRSGIWHEVTDSVYVKSFETYTDTIYY